MTAQQPLDIFRTSTLSACRGLHRSAAVEHFARRIPRRSQSSMHSISRNCPNRLLRRRISSSAVVRMISNKVCRARTLSLLEGDKRKYWLRVTQTNITSLLQMQYYVFIVDRAVRHQRAATHPAQILHYLTQDKRSRWQCPPAYRPWSCLSIQHPILCSDYSITSEYRSPPAKPHLLEYSLAHPQARMFASMKREL